jgi:hypothetical protein
VRPANEHRNDGDGRRAEQHGSPDSGNGRERSASYRSQRLGAARDGEIQAGDPAQERVGHLALPHSDRRDTEQSERRAADEQKHRSDDHITVKAEGRLGGGQSQTGNQE